MTDELLIDVHELQKLIDAEDCVVADCRFDLSDPGKGRQAWLAGHIPGAHYLHLDDDLAGPVTPDSGRHPLPSAEDFSLTLSRIGWSPGRCLVAYDGGPNAISARLWWLMRYFGHEAVLLDGGLAAWSEAGLPLEAGETARQASPQVRLQPAKSLTADADEILRHLGNEALTVVDARGAERFSGAVEPLDTRAGHIPGALNRPLTFNNAPDHRFKPAGTLRSEFEELLQGRNPETVVHSCGSGVTACHNYFAMELAGMTPGRVYPGSWSEWIRDPGRPIE